MKKMLSIFLVFTMSSIFIIGCGNNPYVGRYKSSDNTILDLSLNGNCTIINSLYKEAFYTNGKYVIKDNKIEITFENNEQSYYEASGLKGKFEGSNIKLYNCLGVEKDYIISK